MKNNRLVWSGISILLGLLLAYLTLHFTSTTALASGLAETDERSQSAASGTIEVPVYVLVYGDPANAPESFDIGDLITATMDTLNEGTQYHGYKNPAASPVLHYTVYKFTQLITSTVPKLNNGTSYTDQADIHKIYYEEAPENLCMLALEGKIKQVWIWLRINDANNGGGFETADQGPTWQWQLDHNVPNCGVQVTTAFLGWELPVANALESHIHRYEYFFASHSPWALKFQHSNTDSSGNTKVPYFAANSTPPPGLPACIGTDGLWCDGNYINSSAEEYGFTALAKTITDTAQCGWAHYPPNITWELRTQLLNDVRYYYNYTGTVQTKCTDWNESGTGISETISCDAWGCIPFPRYGPGSNLYLWSEANTKSHASFFRWWMQNIPENWWSEMDAHLSDPSLFADDDGIPTWVELGCNSERDCSNVEIDQPVATLCPRLRSDKVAPTGQLTIGS
jgi:hypothetical protein